jgi:hypothetical protein
MQDSPSLTVFEQWRLACQLATDAECAIADASLRYFSGSSPHPPGERQLALAARLRAHATSLYHVAMAEVERVSGHAAKVACSPTPRARAQRAVHDESPGG